MGLLELLQRARRSDESTLYECRDCGTCVFPEREKCPSCGSTEIACYEF
ncbi:zinc ribbon domain-containing protein [Haloferax prahovense]|nr:zinc ribbon domain-containing protein [Haloferax prahovense]